MTSHSEMERAHGQSALTRAFRGVVTVGAVVQVLFAVSNEPAIASQWSATFQWFSVTLIVVWLIAPLALAAATFVVPVGLGRRVAAGVVVAMLVTHVVWIFARTGPDALHGNPPWINMFTAFLALFAGASLPLGGVVSVGLAEVALVFWTRYESFNHWDILVTLDGFGTFGPVIVFGGVVYAFVRYAHVVDSELRRVGEVATAAATAEAQSREIAEVNADIHDEILAVLAAVKMVSPDLNKGHVDAAIAAIDGLAGARKPALAPGAGIGAITRQAFERWIGIVPWATFAVSDSRVAPLGAAVVGAVVEAGAEALSNVARHATGGLDRRVAVSVDLTVDGDGVHVEIADDGVGFVPDSVARERLGVRGSIVGRMRALPGGSAEIVSRVGRGTVVRLDWRG